MGLFTALTKTLIGVIILGAIIIIAVVGGLILLVGGAVLFIVLYSVIIPGIAMAIGAFLMYYGGKEEMYHIFWAGFILFLVALGLAVYLGD